MTKRGYTLAGAMLSLLVCSVLLGGQAATLHHYGLLGHAVGAKPTVHGPALITDGSLSVLGQVSPTSNPTVGRLKDSASGPDTKSCVNDGTHNGVNDRQTVWERRNDGSYFVSDEVTDKNGTKRGGNCHILRDPKEKHQVNSITGGTVSVHRHHQGSASPSALPTPDFELAHWYFTCRTDRMRHAHPLRGVINRWRNIIVLHRGGKRYVRGTWDTFDIGREKIINQDRKTYGPC